MSASPWWAARRTCSSGAEDSGNVETGVCDVVFVRPLDEGCTVSASLSVDEENQVAGDLEIVGTITCLYRMEGSLR
jgi:hypothetical protein